MDNKKEYGLNDIVEMKKEHACHKAKTWQIIRMGADIKIKCQGCGAVVMFPRHEFERKMKRVVQKAPEDDKEVDEIWR